MVVVALFSPSLTSVAVSIGIVSWPQVARVTHSATGKYLARVLGDDPPK